MARTGRMTTIELLAEKYFKCTGTSPEYSFWGWLDAMGIEPDEKELKDILNDEECWEGLREEML